MNIYAPLDNKYYKWYLNICLSRKYRQKQKGLVKHHIIPDCFYVNSKRKYSNKGWLDGNPDDKNNLIYLTDREHFLVHWLLCYCYDNILPRQKMTKAFNRMCNGNKSSQYYEIAMKLYKKSIEGKGNFNSGNIVWNKGKKNCYSQNTLNLMSRKGKKDTVESIIRRKNSIAKYWMIINSHNNFQIIHNLKEFCKSKPFYDYFGIITSAKLGKVYKNCIFVKLS